MAAIYIQCINLITVAKGISPLCHYHWQQSTWRQGFVIRYPFIKEIYYDYVPYGSTAARVSRLYVADGILYQ